ncbi:hypothetical protein DE146DRAFT_678412 [Phaeosphaeria sp. MPI-PUGE-AT-0046c]|nr:hypothetical protein DE146DRAFT_678412 [Phaeosphaeria sp. MPI-PUGE-AT-0046c]
MISLPLAKISTAQDASLETTNFVWTHETQGLMVVLDDFGAHRPPAQLLKVVQGTQVRHLIEIERLINESDELIRSMRVRGVELKHDQLPISALVRCPLLAFRWQIPDNKIRRLQLRFQTTGDYNIAYNHLQKLGLWMTAANSGQSRAPSSGPALNSSSIISPTPNRGPATRNSGASYSSSRQTETYNRPFTAVTAPTSVESELQEAAQARPASSYTGSFCDMRNRTLSLTGPLRPPEYFPRPTSAASIALDNSVPVHASNDQTFHTRTPEFQSSGSRPETAMLFNRPDTAEAALPPRRELPFSRLSPPRSAGSDDARPNSRPSTGLMGPPPLPQRVASLRPASSRAATDSELPPLPKPTIVSGAQQQPSWMRQAPRTPENDQVTSPGAQAAYHDGQENRSLSSSSSNFSPLSYKRPSSNTSPPHRPLSSLSNSGQNRCHTDSPSSQSSSTPRTTCKSYVSAGTSNQPNLNLSTDLADYAMQPEEGRRAALNEFLFRNLESDNFLTLLEDMETCWARAGLGMK